MGILKYTPAGCAPIRDPPGRTDLISPVGLASAITVGGHRGRDEERNQSHWLCTIWHF